MSASVVSAGAASQKSHAASHVCRNVILSFLAPTSPWPLSPQRAHSSSCPLQGVESNAVSFQSVVVLWSQSLPRPKLSLLGYTLSSVSLPPPFPPSGMWARREASGQHAILGSTVILL